LVNDGPIRALAETVVWVTVYIESASDDDINPDAAVDLEETISLALGKLSADDRAALAASILEIASAERRVDVAEMIRGLPTAIGLTED
jgi:hypothetical protein